jgi:hypothetical protein
MAKNKSNGKTNVPAIAELAKRSGAIVTRFAAVETAAHRIHEEQSGAKLVRALMNGGKLHAVVSDGQTTLEVLNGTVVLSVAQPE